MLVSKTLFKQKQISHGNFAQNSIIDQHRKYLESNVNINSYIIGGIMVYTSKYKIKKLGK